MKTASVSKAPEPDRKKNALALFTETEITLLLIYLPN